MDVKSIDISIYFDLVQRRQFILIDYKEILVGDYELD